MDHSAEIYSRKSEPGLYGVQMRTDGVPDNSLSTERELTREEAERHVEHLRGRLPNLTTLPDKTFP